MPSAQPPVPVVPTQAWPLPQRPLALQVEPSAHARQSVTSVQVPPAPVALSVQPSRAVAAEAAGAVGGAVVAGRAVAPSRGPAISVEGGGISASAGRAVAARAQSASRAIGADARARGADASSAVVAEETGAAGRDVAACSAAAAAGAGAGNTDRAIAVPKTRAVRAIGTDAGGTEAEPSVRSMPAQVEPSPQEYGGQAVPSV